MLARVRLEMVGLTAVLAVVVGGCSKQVAFPELHPLSGTVTREGQPVTTGGLVFIPEGADGAGLTFNAVVDGDGRFEARTSRSGPKNTVEFQSGIPAGRYKVVYHPPSDGRKAGLESEVDERVTVQSGQNTVEVKLPAGGEPEKGESKGENEEGRP